MWKNILIPIFVLVLLGCFMGGAAASDVKLPTPPSKFNPGEHGYKPVYKDNWRGAKDVTLKWSQMPDLDPTGMDVADYNNPPYPPYLLADDFECTTTGPITDITIWGSWWQDYLPNQDPLSVTFTVSIHADIPAADNPYGAYSMPGETLWLGTPETVVADIFFIGQEGWFEPPDSYDPLGDTQCWMYSFHFDQPFIQQGTPDIPIVYWVDIQAQPHDPNAFFGWKTSIDHWNDDAAWTISEEPIPGGDPPWQWFELRYPPGHPWEPQSIDLAFEIYGEEEEPPLGACCYPDGSCINLDQTNCLQSGGVWAGAGSMCMGDSDGNYIDDACEGFYPTGACCFPDLSCIVTYQPACEIVAGGTYKGDGTDCSDTSPPNGIADICETQQTMGACCLPDGSCVMMDQVSCEALVGAWYVGDNIFCQGDFNSNGIDDICESDTTVKWDQLPDLDPTGMDVSAFNHPQFPPFILADDFPCTQTGPITRIEIWGSWWQDQMPIDPPAFVISFHRDIPADENPYGHWSMPGELLWLDTLYIYDQLLYAENLEEGWFEPPSSYDPIGDTQCWMYRFYEFDQPFIQEGTPEDTVIYWLDVQILLPLHETAFFGWKTSLDHWNDDAVWIQAIEPLPPDPPPMWNELRYPDLHPMHPQSIDLAFRIFGEAGPLTGACCFPDGSCLDLNAGDCANAAGVWGGPGTFCMGDGDGNFIDDACEGYYPTGACCFPDQSCMVTYQPACVIAGGTYMGDGTDCTDGDGNLIADICEEDTLFKWQQFPDLEPTGIDVCASNQWILGQWLLADDFLCTQYGPITEIKVWGSWYDDILPAAPPTFVLSFHRDIPANENPNGPYSQPGELLWLDTLNVYDEILFAGNLEEGFLLPPEDYYPIGDTQCWLYRFTDFDDPFIQQGTPEEPIVYWLDVQVIIPMPDVAVFGWKTSLDHWNDDAVWINGIEPTDPLAVWHELIYPEQHPMYPQSIDLAFELLGESQEPPLDTCTYYKQPYPDYAPNGMPDFDQKQDAWTGATGGWSYCGPVALANCFWWFDSKFEPSPVDPRPFWPDPTSPGMNDGYPLVTSYDPGGIWDDHDMNNVMPFVDSLALYSNCNPTTPGTFVLDLVNGANTWLNTQLLGANYTVTPHPIPPFELIRDEVLISQDVILLLGFYEFLPSGECNRLGGHYVTVAGVCEEEWQLCLSDPWYDRNEGEPPSGSAHGAGVHNDAHHVSGPHGTIHHDPYNVALNIPPACIPIGGPPPIIELADYPDSYPDIANFDFQNQTDPPVDPQPYTGGDIFTFVDYAIIICPVEPEPDIDVAPDTVEYEQCIETDTIYTAQFQVCNVGTAPLMVNGITCDLGFVSVVNTMPIVIPATGCVDIDIQINTTGITSGAYMGDFHVNSSDPDEPVVDEPHIRVDVVEQDIAVAPDSLYHQQDINTIVNYPTDFTIYNNGDCPLSYTVMYVPTWATLAGITGYIPPSGNDPIDVQINTNGLSAGTYIDSIRIDSDDPDTPILYKPKIVLEVVEESTWLAYLAGDANMFNGTWPPSVIGSDVTYLVNYFRSMPSSQPCFMFNAGALIAPPYFWASADANGDCLIIGSDVTKLVTYFRGLTTISNCSDFPPDYPPIPPVMPPGWPNCQTPPPALKTVIPSETDK